MFVLSELCVTKKRRERDGFDSEDEISRGS